MKRRNLIKLTAIAPLAAPILPHREVREGLEINGETSVHIIITAHLSAKDAERYRSRWIGQPFEGLGEWNLYASEYRELPEELKELPGSMSFHEYLFGESGEYRSILVGAFRREHLTFIIRTQGDEENLLIGLAEWIASQQSAEPGHLLWSDAPLLELIPESEDLGMDVVPSSRFWP